MEYQSASEYVRKRNPTIVKQEDQRQNASNHFDTIRVKDVPTTTNQDIKDGRSRRLGERTAFHDSDTLSATTSTAEAHNDDRKQAYTHARNLHDTCSSDEGHHEPLNEPATVSRITRREPTDQEPAIGFHDIAGDSLPDTTSGSLSIPDPTEYQALNQDRDLGVTAAMPVRGFERRLGMAQNAGLWSNPQDRGTQSLAVFDHRQPRPAVATKPMPNMTEGFAFEPPTKRSSEPTKHQSTTGVEQSRSSLTYHARVPNVHHENNHDQEHDADIDMQESPALNKPRRKPKKATVLAAANAPVQQHAAKRRFEQGLQDPAEDTLSGANAVRRSDIELDYTPDELDNMTFEELRSAPFDEDPHGQEFRLNRDQEGKPLPDQLAYVAKLSVQDQSKFLTGLSCQAWEEAGSWMIEQFAALNNRLVEARLAKRRAAEVFEQEIEARYEAVKQKREETDSAMEIMRRNGTQLLGNTPKKLR